MPYTDRARRLECYKQWRKANPKRVKLLNKRHYAANRTEQLEYKKKWYRKNRSRQQEQKRFRNYGITPEQYNELLIKQNGRCALCNRLPTGRRTALDVDHNHGTKEVRGLLCSKCNTALHQDHDLEYFKKVVAYLQQGSYL